MGKRHEDWQVKQADTALRLYDYFLSKTMKPPIGDAPYPPAAEKWKSLEGKMRDALRLRHTSLSTEKIYLTWLEGFKCFVGQKEPYQLEGRDLQELLGHRNLQTTMIYTHVASKNILGVRSPLDR